MPQLQLAPFWRDVLDGQVLFSPVTRPMIQAAQRAAGDLGEDAPSLDVAEAFAASLLTASVKDWRGFVVLNEDGTPGDPLPFTPDNLALALLDPDIYAALGEICVAPVYRRLTEKNVSALSPAGTSPERAVTAEAAALSAAPPSATPAPARAKTSPRPPTAKTTSAAPT